MKKTIVNGALSMELSTKVVTWFSRMQNALITSIVVFDREGKEADAFSAGWGQAVDPIAAHRLHRLANAMQFVDAEGEQLRLATAAATLGCASAHLVHADPAEAQEQLRTQLCEGYDTAIDRYPDDVTRDLRMLRSWGMPVSVETVQQDVVAGRIPFSTELAQFGVLSTEQHEAREQAREAVLAPLRPHLRTFSESQPAHDDEALKILEGSVLYLAARGVVDPDLLLGYAIYRRLAANQEANAALEGMTDIFGFGSLFRLVAKDMGIDASERRKPNAAAEAAHYTRHYLGEIPGRDDQWLRWAIAGIANDLSCGCKNLKDVVRNDL